MTGGGHQAHHTAGRQAPATAAEARGSGRRGWPAQAWAPLSGVIGTIGGIAPHVLHHLTPLAGAALVTGSTGSVLFGVLGFALTVPMLLRLRRRFRSWLAPGIALTLFIVMFTVSTVWIGPAIRGEEPASSGAPVDGHGH
jgi:hypothetical protein